MRLLLLLLLLLFMSGIVKKRVLCYMGLNSI